MADAFTVKTLNGGSVLFNVDESGNVTAAGTITITGTYDLLAEANSWTAEQTFTAGIALLDSDNITLGTGDDDTIGHDGTDTTWTHTTGDLVIDNTDVNDPIVLRVGADSSATTIDFRNNSDVSLFSMIPSGAAAGDFKGLDNADFVVGTGNDFRVNHNGTLTTITSATGDLVIDNTDTDDQIIVRVGTDTTATGIEFRNNSDVAMWAVEPISASAGRLRCPDNSTLVVGTGGDDTISHDGTLTTWTHITGDLLFDNTDTNDQFIFRVGTDTAATGIEFRNDSNTALFSWDGLGTIRAGADMWATCPSQATQSVLTHEFYDDFTEARFSATQWVVTEDDAADTQTAGDVQSGVLTLTQKAATDDDAAQVTWATETFKLTLGKKLWFEARIKSSSGDMVNSDWFVGLMEAEDMTGVADNMPANGIGFHKDDGAATFSASSSDNGTNLQSAAVGTIVDATWIRIGLLFDGGATGAATITPYINGVAGTAISSVTYATMAEMAVLVMLRNGDNVTTQTLDVDYVKVVTER
jgi:hypothetical protein